MRRVGLAGTASLIVLSIVLLGASPALQALQQRVEMLEAQVAELEAEPRAPHVFAATGADLGILLNAGSSNASIYHEGLEAVFVLLDGKFAPPGSIRFEGPNCSGQALIEFDLADRILISGPPDGTRVFVGDGAVLLEQHAFSSTFNSAGCKNDGGTLDVVEAREVTFNNLGFKPPVPLPLSFGPPAS